MKYGIIIIVILLLGVLIYLIPTKIIKKSYKIENVNYFYLSYTKGYAINCNVEYRIDTELNATIKPYQKSEEEQITVKVDESVLKEIEDVLVKYEVGKWNGFDKSNKYVSDGDSFDFNVKMKNGKEIDARGYASWPNNYSSVIKEIDEIFLRIYNENVGK